MVHLQNLPLASHSNLDSVAILKQVSVAQRFLAELKGAAGTIPNEEILIDTLGLQEAKNSSAIENIITTQDDLFLSDFTSSLFPNAAAKEVHQYANGLRIGWYRLREQKFLRLGDIEAIQAAVVGNNAGLRKLPGTTLKNEQTGQIVYEPPQEEARIRDLMDNFLEYFNQTEPLSPDLLVRMAILHYQFESIHPFYDGNGRTGRILNLLYLGQHGLLDIPVLYLSRYIVRNKAAYYQGLQAVRETGELEPWILYILRAVEETSRETLQKVNLIRDLMLAVKHRMREELPKIYSQDLLNHLFRHPYTKIKYLQRDTGKSRITATKYLNLLRVRRFVRKIQSGRTNYYINTELVDILSR